MTEYSTDKLADLIDKRHRCLTNLRDLGTLQSGLIRDGNMPALLRTFATKNQWIVGLQSIERELAPFHQEDADTRVWRSPEARQLCADQAAQCKQLLSEVMNLEVANEKAMTARRDKVAAQLQTAHTANAARSAYQSHSNAVPPKPHVPTSVFANGAGTTGLDLQSEAT